MRDFLFADVCALNASSGNEIQRNMDKCSSACDGFGLVYFLGLFPSEKTEVIFQPVPHTNYSDPTITVQGQKLQTVDKLTYLGSTGSRNLLIDDDGAARIAKGSTVFGKLRKNVWER